MSAGKCFTARSAVPREAGCASAARQHSAVTKDSKPGARHRPRRRPAPPNAAPPRSALVLTTNAAAGDDTRDHLPGRQAARNARPWGSAPHAAAGRLLAERRTGRHTPIRRSPRRSRDTAWASLPLWRPRHFPEPLLGEVRCSRAGASTGGWGE